MSGLAYRHQRVQRLRRLVGRRSARKDEGRFVIEGVNLLEEALESEARIEAVYVDGEWGQEGRRGKLGGSVHEAVPPDEVSADRLGPCSDGATSAARGCSTWSQECWSGWQGRSLPSQSWQ